jgi:hypothetical protein
MTIALDDIARCFQGEIPSIMATCSTDGTPNLVHLSQVFLVDADHVATSNQFFSKTAANLADNPIATLMCPDPVTLDSFKLLVQLERTELEGPLFDSARRSIEAIASLTGMVGVFELRAVDVFRVLDVSAVPSVGTEGSA